MVIRPLKQKEDKKEDKMECKNILVDGIEYVPKIASDDIRIVILQRGWVLVGRYSQEGSSCRLDNASVIRIWGTTKGLGEIALNGPTLKTILDPCPTVNFHELTVIATIDCASHQWLPKLS